MGILKKAALAFIANSVGLYLAGKFVAGVAISLALEEFAVVALVLTIFNFIIAPILRLVLSPLIILTLGVGSIVINAAILYALDFLLPTITIGGLIALILATLIVSAANIIIHFLAKLI